MKTPPKPAFRQAEVHLSDESIRLVDSYPHFVEGGLKVSPKTASFRWRQDASFGRHVGLEAFKVQIAHALDEYYAHRDFDRIVREVVRDDFSVDYRSFMKKLQRLLDEPAIQSKKHLSGRLSKLLGLMRDLELDLIAALAARAAALGTKVKQWRSGPFIQRSPLHVVTALLFRALRDFTRLSKANCIKHVVFMLDHFEIEKVGSFRKARERVHMRIRRTTDEDYKEIDRRLVEFQIEADAFGGGQRVAKTEE